MRRIKQIVKAILKQIHHFFTKEVPVYVQVNTEECLKYRTALITGGTSGIGYAMADLFLKSGANVIITGRDKEKLDKSVVELQTKYGECIKGICFDNKDIKKIDNFVEEADSIFNGFDILVNNAGVRGKTSFPNITEEDFENVFDTNVKATFFLSQSVANYYIKEKIRGNILNVGSSSCLSPAISPYTMTKWSIRGLTLGMAKSLAKYGVTVNGIAPGPTATPLLPEGMENLVHTRIPSERYVTAEEVASLAVKMVSESGRMIMGDMVYITGGAGNLTYEYIDY